MKWKIILILLFTFIHSDILAQSVSFQKLIGKWEAVDAENKSGGLEIIDSSNIFLVYGSEKKPVASFKADFTKNPGWFDFTISEANEPIHIKSLIHFINDNLVQWQVFQGDAVRPAHFTEERGEILYLRKKKE